MPELLAAKTPAGLLAPLHEYMDQLDYIGQGEVVKVKITKSRNLVLHRRFFALVRALWQLEKIQDNFGSEDEIRAWLTVAAGHCTTLHLNDDFVVKIPKSIKFEKMDDTEFQAFYDRAVNAVLTKFLPEFKGEDFMDYLDQFARF